MNQGDRQPGYRIWAADDVVYGPVTLPRLVEWIVDERLELDSWTYLVHDGMWMKAGDIPELSVFFKPALELNLVSSRTHAEPQVTTGYRIWAADDVVYGPVILPRLVEWTREGRVESGTWVYIDHQGNWVLAPQIPPLAPYFPRAGGEGPGRRGRGPRF